jgi:hypothetical protein
MIELLISNFSNQALLNFVRTQNSSFVEYNENLPDVASDFEKFDNLTKVGEIEFENTDVLLVFTCEYLGELTSRSSKKAQYEIAKKVLKDVFKDGAVFVFYDEIGNFRFSFIRRNYGNKEQKYTNWKRYTYFVEPNNEANRTFKERVGSCKFDSLDHIQEAFSVDKLTTDFYKELSDWFFWAIQIVKFPNDANDESDDEKYNSENIIRLITRLIFVWFLKQKGLIKSEIFDPKSLAGILKNFDAESPIQNNYYRAILQNLFFATLNQEIGKRGFAEDINFNSNRSTNNIKSLYRYENEFVNDTTKIMELFSQVPFLNGGLFECLDRREKDGKMYDWDGFSRNSKRQAIIPNYLFFAKEFKVDLSGEYNDKKKKSEKVSGIIEILNRYNFTIEENTPVEIEVALDPELLGKVFENLLGAFNPETKETARKQTGSFYTPREIVKYMVDESLIAYLQSKIPDLQEEKLRLLFSYDDKEVEITDLQRESLIQTAFDCKILDPACGSGAFPMGILQQMVHILKKLDPDNTHWNNVVLTQAMKDYQDADKLSEEDIEQLRNDIEKTFDEGLNYPDYARKLHLIENCIYGVDIQSIAVQISKLRFFISLVCEQKRNTESSENFGIRPLPNLETKFVAANTLIGLEKTDEDLELFNDDHIKILTDKLQHVRHRQFLVTNTTEKKRLRDKDKKLREDIENEVTQLYKKHKDDNKTFYERQKVLAEKELELMDKTLERSTISPNIFGERITKTYKPNEKRKNELKRSIEALTIKISDSSDFSRLGAVVNLAKQLTSWNPYDQNNHSDFFDPEWMFGLKKQDDGYFDVVIGNPPYVQLQKMKEDALILKRQNFETFESTGDLYCLFYEKGIKLLKGHGFETFITSSQWLKAGYGKSLRKFFLKYNPVCLLELGPGVFESATVDSNILIIQNNLYLKELKGAVIDKSFDVNSTQTITLPDIDENSWAIITSIQQNINNKIKSNSKPLKQWKLKIYRGVLTGFNEAFIIDQAKKNELIEQDAKCAEILKPIFRGREIETYFTRWDGGYIINSHNGIKEEKIAAINIDDYSVIKSHINSYSPKVFDRYDQGNTPYNLRNCAYLNEFSKEKIIWKRIGSKLRFTYSSEEMYCLDSTCIATGEKMKYLTAFLNSRLCHYQLFEKAPKTGMGDLIISVQALEPLLVYYPNEKQENLICTIVNQIINRKSLDEDTLELEQQIDLLVYHLYDFTYDEVKVIDPDIENKLSEAEYNAITLD